MILQIASINMPLCVTTLTYDTNSCNKPSEKNGYLKLISLLIRHNPLILYKNLPPLVESIVKSLDPNIADMRDTVLQTATNVLHELVKRFPSIAFHGGSQKLAIGTLEGAAIIYDLRTATRWHILEVLESFKNCSNFVFTNFFSFWKRWLIIIIIIFQGHIKPVTALKFSNDGRIIVSCSLEEGVVNVWNPNPGIFGMIAGSLTSSNKVGNRNSLNGLSPTSSRNEIGKGVKKGLGFKNSLSSSIRPIKSFSFNLGEDGEKS